MHTANQSIPQIDLSPLWEGADQGFHQVAKLIKDAYQNSGFAYITNHNIPQSVIENAFHASKEFFALDLEEKLKVRLNSSFRGYIPMESSRMKYSSLGETKSAN